MLLGVPRSTVVYGMFRANLVNAIGCLCTNDMPAATNCDKVTNFAAKPLQRNTCDVARFILFPTVMRRFCILAKDGPPPPPRSLMIVITKDTDDSTLERYILCYYYICLATNVTRDRVRYCVIE